MYSVHATQSSVPFPPVESLSPELSELPDPPLSPVELLLLLELEFELSALSDWLFEDSRVVVLFFGRVVARGGLGLVMTLRSGALK